MKKTAFLWTVVVFLLTVLTSCEGISHSNEPFPSVPETGEIQIVTNLCTLSATLDVFSEGGGKYTVHQPKTMENMIFQCQNQQYSVCAGDLSLLQDPDFFPDKGKLFEALVQIKRNETPLKSSKSEDGKTYTVYTYVGKEYNFVFYCLDGKAIRLDAEGSFPVTVKWQ